MLFGQVHECWTIFETERLEVREIKESDLPALFALYEKPGAADFIEPLFSYEEELAYTRDYITKIYGFYGYGMWVIIQKETGNLIGRVGFDDRTTEETGRILELGFMIDPDLWRQGYATEACTASIDYAFTTLDEEVVSCLVHPQNTASMDFLKTLGFSYREDVHLSRGDFQWWELYRNK